MPESLSEIFEGKKLKTRTEVLPGDPERVEVPDDKVDWNVPFEGYKPPYYLGKKIKKKMVEGDPETDSEDITQVDWEKRQKFGGQIDFDENGHPRNPWGRTGLSGRGLCNKWGPNPAADPMVTRYNPETESLEMLVVQRKDNGQWAFPGGKIKEHEPESATDTAVRELYEEALEPGSYEIKFTEEEKVYDGVQDDPRNTDQAWFRAAVYHKHLPFETAQELKIAAKDGADAVQWIPLTPENIGNFFAGHGEIVKSALEKMEKEAKEGIDPIRSAVRKALGRAEA